MMTSHSVHRNHFRHVGSGIRFVACLTACVLVGECIAQTSDPKSDSDDTSEITLSRLEELHRAAAKEYVIFPDETRKDRLALEETPISQWVNPRRAGGQLGHVFVWTNGEEPAALGAMFSFPWGGVAKDRRIVHELHALAPNRLSVTRLNATSKWNPKSGLKRRPIPGLKMKSESISRFRIQVRQISRRFSGYCVDGQGQRWELRLLPTPLAVYPIDREDGSAGYGALMGFMGDAGSDLESAVIIESLSTTRPTEDASPRWLFAPIRLTDMETYLSYDSQLVWESVRKGDDTLFHDAQHLYFRFQDKTVSLD